MEFSWLQSFVTLENFSSIRTAAAEIGISPSVLSDRLNSLEDEVGVKLFERTPSGCVFTPAGQVYLKEARQLLERWNSITSNARKMNSESALSLKICLQGHTLPPVIGPRLDLFMEQHPSIELSIFDDNEIGLEEGLQTNAVDLYCVFQPSEVATRNFRRRAVFHTGLAAILPPNHPLSSKSPLSLSDLDGETFILYPQTKEKSLRDFEIGVLNKSGIGYSICSGHLSSNTYLLASQMLGGIIIVPLCMKRGVPPMATVVALSDDFCSCNIELVYNPDNTNPALTEFLDIIKDVEGEDVK